MGSFFLFKNGCVIQQDALRSVFYHKGFGPPVEFSLGNMTLWLYKKQLVNNDNYLIDQQGDMIFVTGTVVYRGRSYSDSLQILLQDFKNGCLEFDELLGNFCLIFYVRRQIQILTDKLNVHHIFIDESASRLSSSFLAMVASFSQPLALNRLAFYEKISTGYIVGPDTLVSNIYQLTPQLQQKMASDDIKFIPNLLNTCDVNLCSDGFDACLEMQLHVLEDYFRQIRPLAQEFGSELGLSSGYDSRLVFLLSQHASLPLDVHTHATKGVHDKDCRIVTEMAQLRDTKLRMVETYEIEEHEEDSLLRILADGLYYFDGRNSHNMGAFSETYTRAYKIKTLGECRLSLNGLGGEIYRNYYFSSRRRFDFSEWMTNHVYYLFAAGALPAGDSKQTLHNYIITKLMKRLAVDLTGQIDLLTMRRYYSEIRMPDCDGINHNAHNQLCFYLTPFIEEAVIREGYRATPYIGLSGRFQAAMLARLDPTIAAIESHYGFPLSKEPLSHTLYSILKGYLPDRLWNMRTQFRIRYQHLGQAQLETYLDLQRRSQIIQEGGQALRDFFPQVDWHMLMRASDSRATAVFMGYFLREFNSILKT